MPSENQPIWKRWLGLPNDSTEKTIIVALALCLVCSIVVSAAAVTLKPLQIQNKTRDLKNNILAVAGLQDIVEAAGKDYDSMSVVEKFEFIEMRIVNLETGEYADDIDPAGFDYRAAAADLSMSVELNKDQDIAGIGRRATYAPVYLVKDGENVRDIIIPVYGKGLWSTLYGFLAMKNGSFVVNGLSFYEHKETPGLGGEVDNPSWKAQFAGKLAYDDAGMPRLELAKGSVDSTRPEAVYQVDGLSGATLTSRGVTNLLQFWLGDDGFGKYLAKRRS